ncbi:mercury(II) reductase [Marinilabilia salmonicolor]|uniref:Mercuric reductase n=1 Tax=Marinilabilia salmonicolor TaxID=989 RepID=A0A368VB23_9BACT|nr:mercury(II) reductase [Marinilabilia salmonicolor]RCW38328.1 mercuric reductase [Marinilabilia salmonicolor]
MKFVEFKIKGMTCDHCAQTIANQFKGKEGIVNKDISYPSGSGKFEYDPEKISKDEIAGLIDSTGHYKVAGEAESEGNEKTSFDLVIIGGGSAAFSAAIKAESMGLSTLMVNDGLDFGGTCVNVGCVPSKNLIRAGETVYHASHSNFTGINPKAVDVDFAKVIQDKKKLVASLQEKKYMDVVRGFENLTMLKGWATFKDHKTIQVEGKEYKGLKFLIATGATTMIPEINGLNDVPYLTNVSLFDLEEQPKSMVVLGGGYIALEIAQAYHRLGTKVTLLQRSKNVLSKLTSDISDELLKHLRAEGMEIHTGLSFERVTEENNSIRVLAKVSGENRVFEAEKLVVATGTKPNTSQLAIENADLKLTSTGHIAVNEKMETNQSHIYAAGDVANTPAYVYTAAFEGKTAVENAFSGTDSSADYSSLPWVVFTDPQVTGAGLDETEAKYKGIPYEVSKLELKDVPRALAANDMKGFIKLIRNPETDKLLGARIVAPEGGELIHQLSMAIKYGITVNDLAESFYPYLTLGEGIKLAAITFNKDVSKLSCCAS